MDMRTFWVDVQRDPSGYWAQFGLEGSVAAGTSLDELVAAVSEAVGLYIAGADDSEQRLLTRIAELQLAVDADLRPSGLVPATGASSRRRAAQRPDWPPSEPRARSTDS